MKRSRILIIITLILVTTMVKAQVDADIVVALDGTGDYTKIQDAIDAVESNSEQTTIIYIKRGLYNTEKLIVPDEKKNIALVGESRDETIISYHIYDCSDGKCPVEDAALWTGNNIATSATLTIRGDGFKAENLTIQNTAGPVGQAQAITVQADKVVFVNCNLYGYQDTIYLWTTGIRVFFKGCLIVGRTDYIYGSGIGYFLSCEVRSWGGGWITAPATPGDQNYGFVFYQCDISYAGDSPRNGDDGESFRLGRPWHKYPKVSWLYCDMTGMINPEGWGDTWNMEYAATSDSLELYEYENTGEGADMSNRADWAGIRALTEDEAEDYTAQVVLSGDDSWDPAQDTSMVATYQWTGNGAGTSWLDTNNWEPETIPGMGEAAYVTIADTIISDTGTFEADLSIGENATLMVASNCTINYLAFKGEEILTSGNHTLSGKIAAKDTMILHTEDSLNVAASIINEYPLIKKGSGKICLSGNNESYSGNIAVSEGTLEASAKNSLGTGNVTVANGAVLGIGNSVTLQSTSKLMVETGAMLQLDSTVTIILFYIEGTQVEEGTYDATTNPGLISGEGQLVVKRPDEFEFIGGDDGDWDDSSHFEPALMPEAGELVNCSIEMETTSIPFEADIHLESSGNIRLRGDHTCTGTITMEAGSNFSYNTGGTGFSLDAPIVLQGDVEMIMESGNTDGSTLTLAGAIAGSYTITALNNGKGTVNTGTLVLKGDNTGFTGIWDITSQSVKYPDDDYISAIEGLAENAFGKGEINVDNGNQVVFSHENCVSDTLSMTLKNSAKAVLNTDMELTSLTINSEDFASGTYSSTTHPDYFSGTGTITVSKPATTLNQEYMPQIKIEDNRLIISSTHSEVKVFTLMGTEAMYKKDVQQVDLSKLHQGIYIILYQVDGKQGSMKYLKK